MFNKTDIRQELSKVRDKNRTAEEKLLNETHRILNNDLFTEKKILENLRDYLNADTLLDEEYVDETQIFAPAEIKKLAIHYRLKFLESKKYKPEIPYEAILRIKYLNAEYRKNLKEFYVLSTHPAFTDKHCAHETLLFAKTNYGNYYLVHRWGQSLPAGRKLASFPLRSFESLVLTVFAFTLILALSLPTWVITLDHKATYWCGYRVATFFHLFIFNMGFTTFYTFAFSKNLSSSVWNQQSDFG